MPHSLDSQQSAAAAPVPRPPSTRSVAQSPAISHPVCPVRAVAITDPERNYHIFYQLMAGASAANKGPHLAGLSIDKVHMLNQSKCVTLVGVDDSKTYKETVESMERLGVSTASQVTAM